MNQRWMRRRTARNDLNVPTLYWRGADMTKQDEGHALPCCLGTGYVIITTCCAIARATYCNPYKGDAEKVHNLYARSPYNYLPGGDRAALDPRSNARALRDGLVVSDKSRVCVDSAGSLSVEELDSVVAEERQVSNKNNSQTRRTEREIPKQGDGNRHKGGKEETVSKEAMQKATTITHRAISAQET